jgi:DNA invertase Pin-like site-specific DNA recombinase
MTQPTTRPRAALYARVSTYAQAKDDPWASLPRQLGDMREAARRHGLDVAMEVHEAASGAKADRPEWRRVLDAARAGEVDVIMAVAFDRLTRSERIGDFEALKDEARALGLRLVTVKGGEMDLSGTADAETRSDLEAVFAKRERLIIKERTMRGRRATGEAGGYTGHHPPLGYKTVFDPVTGRKSFPIDEEAAALVRAIFDAYLSGSKHAHIARDLNERGVQAPGKWGRGADFWHVRTVKLILTNPTYAGLSSWHRGKEAPVPSTVFQPIIPMKRWEAAQTEVELRKSRASRGPTSVHPLSGILRCRTCGSKMQFHVGSRRKEGYRNQDLYECWRHDVRQRPVCPEPQYLNATVAEAAVLAYLRERLPIYLSDDVIAAAVDQAQPKRLDRVPGLEKRIAQNKLLQSKTADLLLDTTKAAIAPALEAKLAELVVSLERLEAQLVEARRENIMAVPMHERRKTLRPLLELLDRGFDTPERLRQLFDKAILTVTLVKTSEPRRRQVLEVEKLQLRNKDWL